MTTASLLNLQASARKSGSVTRDLSEELISRLAPANRTDRTISDGLPFIDENWVAANFTLEENRTADQKERLALSDALIAELEAADILIIGVPVYNFGIPASLKAWIDLVARARKTFRYTESGPEGLLKGKKAYLVMASGGTAAGSEIDFATTYLHHILGFLGISDVELIAADAMSTGADDALDRARQAIAALNAA